MTLRVSCRVNDLDKHDKDITALLYHKGKVYSGGDDGKIKVWTSDLVKLQEFKAHVAPVYSIAASDEYIYSSSSDGCIKVYDLATLQEKPALKLNEDAEYWRVRYINGNLYAGDNEGNVLIYKNNSFYGFVNVAEPIKDLQVVEPYVLTVQDTDCVITEVKLGGENILWATDTIVPGRAPVTLIGDKLFALIDRDGKEILLHSLDKHAGFKQLTKVVHGSENGRVINALTGVEWGDNQFLFSGGWDKEIKKWKVVHGSALAEEANLNLETVITAIVTGETDQVYVGGEDGHMVRVECG